MSQRTLKLQQPRMKGDDVRQWQKDVKTAFKRLSINCPIKADGIYGPATRSYSAALVHATGLSVKARMKSGVTPELRVLIRNNRLTEAQRAMRDSKARKEYRAKLRKQYAQAQLPKVHTPVTVILQDSWGWHPGVHDGVDVITQTDPVIFAMVKSKVVDVRSSGWWGLGAPKDPKLKAKGDGIIQLEVLESVGPFKKGMHIAYGHAEQAVVKVGQIIKAGEPIGRAGFANAWHIHLMVNDGKQGNRGVGTQDPRPLLDYAVKNG